MFLVDKFGIREVVSVNPRTLDKIKMSTIDIDRLTGIDEIKAVISEHEHNIFRKTVLIQQIKDDKKKQMAAYRDQIKQIEEETEKEIEVVKAAFARKQVLGFVD